MVKDSERAEALRLLEEGVPVTEVARRLSVTRRSIYNWRKAKEKEEEQIPQSPPESGKSGLRNLSPEEQKEARKATLEPAMELPSHICFRGPQDRAQYLECLAEVDGDHHRVVRRSPLGEEPSVVAPPPLPIRPRSITAVIQRRYFGSQRSGRVGRPAREEARAERIREALRPEYLAEVKGLEQIARKAVAYDVLGE